jgi:hypothetical protein
MMAVFNNLVLFDQRVPQNFSRSLWVRNRHSDAMTRSPAAANIDIAVVGIPAETLAPLLQFFVEIVEQEIAYSNESTRTPHVGIRAFIWVMP